MKTSAPHLSSPIHALSATLCSSLVLFAAFGPLSGAARAADDSPYRINVSSSVERAYTRFSKEAYQEHGKHYAIISAAPVEEQPLSHPVNEATILTQLKQALARHGFREATPGTNPDIVLTVLYGRSHMVNPYSKDSVLLDGENGTPTVSVGMAEALAISKAGGQGKLIAAAAEKLFIAVSAWKFPETAKEKPKLAWRTIVNTDDPDEDLNLQSEKMLMAAAVYFDRPIEDPEITFSSDLPEGHVKLGMPTVVEPEKKK